MYIQEISHQDIYILLCEVNSIVFYNEVLNNDSFLSGSIVVICWVLLTYVDVSVLYHIVRGQSVIKLYVIYNMLEVQVGKSCAIVLRK